MGFICDQILTGCTNVLIGASSLFADDFCFFGRLYIRHLNRCTIART